MRTANHSDARCRCVTAPFVRHGNSGYLATANRCRCSRLVVIGLRIIDFDQLSVSGAARVIESFSCIVNGDRIDRVPGKNGCQDGDFDRTLEGSFDKRVENVAIAIGGILEGDGIAPNAFDKTGEDGFTGNTGTDHLVYWAVPRGVVGNPTLGIRIRNGDGDRTGITRNLVPENGWVKAKNKCQNYEKERSRFLHDKVLITGGL